MQKTKTCDGCGQERPIWKSSGTGGLKLCKQCWSCQKTQDNIQKPTNAIPRVSAKRAKKDAEYLKLRERFLTEHSLCELNYACCSNGASDVHHTFAGSNRDAFYLVQSTWKATCRACHQHLHENPAEARILGYLK